MTDPAREQRFLTLLKANLAALGRLAGSYAGSTGERDDLLQEIALALWQALPRFRGECSERTFLFRIAHNRCINHIARRRPMESLQAMELDPADDTRPIEMSLGQAQDSARLLQAVQRLPLIQRQVIVLALEDMDYQEIASVLGISETNVGVRLNRARTTLKRLMGERP
ncbi:MAG TPA: sigma-70 family RNA polymerase sigma factor [Steroidobacteraceae bacterium]|nr:sigma-70 family RNA polymerase sigma factor [Steroidobacteraceae bacterium]